MGETDRLGCFVEALPDDVADFITQKSEFRMHR
jgi:hypothetical protein